MMQRLYLTRKVVEHYVLSVTKWFEVRYLVSWVGRLYSLFFDNLIPVGMSVCVKPEEKGGVYIV